MNPFRKHFSNPSIRQRNDRKFRNTQAILQNKINTAISSTLAQTKPAKKSAISNAKSAKIRTSELNAHVQNTNRRKTPIVRRGKARPEKRLSFVPIFRHMACVQDVYFGTFGRWYAWVFWVVPVKLSPVTAVKES